MICIRMQELFRDMPLAYGTIYSLLVMQVYLYIIQTTKGLLCDVNSYITRTHLYTHAGKKEINTCKTELRNRLLEHFRDLFN